VFSVPVIEMRISQKHQLATDDASSRCRLGPSFGSGGHKIGNHAIFWNPVCKVQMISISFEQRQQFVDDPFAQQMRQIRGYVKC
jgi:hypothetical protein